MAPRNFMAIYWYYCVKGANETQRHIAMYHYFFSGDLFPNIKCSSSLRLWWTILKHRLCLSIKKGLDADEPGRPPRPVVCWLAFVVLYLPQEWGCKNQNATCFLNVAVGFIFLVQMLKSLLASLSVFPECFLTHYQQMNQKTMTVFPRDS